MGKRQKPIQETAYEGEIYTAGEWIRFRKAVDADAGQIARLYREIAVDRGNYREKLLPGSAESFAEKGGMFLLMGEADIRRELRNPHSFWAVFERKDGAIIGSFWFADHNDLLPGWCTEEVPGKEGLNLEKEAPDWAAYPREVITSKQYQGKKLAFLLYATVFAAMLQDGCTYSVCDAYRVAGYQPAGEERQNISLMNWPSIRVMTALGGRFLGRGERKKIALPGLDVWVEPQIFGIEHHLALLLCASNFRKCGINFGGNGQWEKLNRK